MHVTAICPTYRHPKLLAASLAMFQAQTYGDCDLLIVDDGRNFHTQSGLTASGNGWMLLGFDERFESLPVKYNYMLKLALDGGADAVVVWEDDDIYMPEYIERHVDVLRKHELSHPAVVFTDAAELGRLSLEKSGGRFHSSLAFRRELAERTGGWDASLRAGFDLEFIAKLHRAAQSVGSPWPDREPNYELRTPEDIAPHKDVRYVYHWHSGSAHGQWTMTGDPQDEGWYQRAAEMYRERQFVGQLVPQLDHGSELLIGKLL